MKKNIFVLLFVALAVLLYPISAYSETLDLSSLIAKLSKPRYTSLEKADFVDQYRGRDVKGSGRVKDILKNYADESKAKVYLQKKINGRLYEIILTVDKQSAKDIKKGRELAFLGKFAGLAYETIRVEDATLIQRSFGPFKF